MAPLTVGSLFAGIGGFDLGLERAGMKVRWQVENNPFSQHILNKHWPDVPCYGDIREVSGKEVGPVDVLCGGFPCQDISNAGLRAGIEGARSSLWKEVARLVGELRPRYVIVENVAALRRRGLDVVLADLAACGYDAEWDGLRASDFGAPHRRDRIWIVAYPGSERRERGPGQQRTGWQAPKRIEAGDHAGDGRELPHPQRAGLEGFGGQSGSSRPQVAGLGYDCGSRALAAAACVNEERRERGRDTGWRPQETTGDSGSGAASLVADTEGVGQRESRVSQDTLAAGWDPRRIFGSGGERERSAAAATWAVEPDVGRVADGVPARVDRLTGLGNALVPQIAEWIGRRVVADAGS